MLPSGPSRLWQAHAIGQIPIQNSNECISENCQVYVFEINYQNKVDKYSQNEH